MVSGITALALK